PPIAALYVTVTPFVGAATCSNVAKIDQPASEPVPVFQISHPELDRAFADVKKFELTVQLEVPTTSGPRAGQQASVSQVQLSKTAVVTTDPVQNLTQQQLPPRIVAVLKVVTEAKTADRSKPGPPDKDVIASAPATQFTDFVRPVERLDEAPLAHTVEIP